ncbi:MAG: rhomboid family intramembrane serine protease [Gemmatimonadetes bacterium]|nr:MAG: rhomboid family intramembrane serine protease [Gemmatimonadota bacterium]
MPGLTRVTGSRTLSTLTTQAVTVGGTLATFWAAFAANLVTGGALIQYGVIPRTTTGLRGILFAPFIHGSLNHLVANSVPFLVLGWLVMLRNARHFIPVTLVSMLGAGLMAWLVGAPGSMHVGASGVVFGYLGFLMLSGWFARSFASIALSIGVTVAWGGLVFGVMPGEPGISWQAHLGGFLGGVLAARWLGRRR